MLYIDGTGNKGGVTSGANVSSIYNAVDKIRQ